jgi:cytochrome P450 family 6
LIQTSSTVIFFFAGSDTTSTIISFAITQLSRHPDLQEKLRQEILAKVKADGGEITYENLHEMTYLTQVMNGEYLARVWNFSLTQKPTETLRMYPPTVITVRTASSDYQIPGSRHVIKKGQQVIIPVIGIHYDDRYWENPSEFNPDRFTAEEIAKRPNFAFLPFGEGPRNCIGMR